jgi:serine/threonine protein kinase
MTIDASQGDLLAGRYRLDTPLGSGGMGRVWRGRDEVLGREVALKELRIPPGMDHVDAQRLTRRSIREAQAAGRLVHRNIVTVYDVVYHDERPWIVMQLVSGRTLDQVIRAEGPLPAHRAARIALQILDALHAAHAAGVVHRDVKPGNVIVRPGDEVVLTDFGIATIAGDPGLTSSGTLLGSPTYLAPERALGDTARPESDLWSVGATLYAMVEGHPPYQRETPVATLAAVINDPPPPHRQQGLMAVVLGGLLRKEPAGRMSAQLATALLGQIAATPGNIPEPIPMAAVPPNPPPVPATPAPVPAPDESATTSLDVPDTLALDIPPVRPTPPVPAAGRKPRRWPVVAAVAAVAAVLAGLLLAGILRDENTGTSEKPAGGPAPPPTATTAGPASATPRRAEPAPPPTPSAPEESPTESAQVPDGFRLHRDPTGFSLAIPENWIVSRREHYVYVREPESSRFLLIDQTDQPKQDAVADWTRQETARRSSLVDYERIRIARVDYFLEAADWEFRHTRGDTRLHVINRGFVTSEERAYGLYWSTPEDQWDESRPYFDTFTRSFQPAS